MKASREHIGLIEADRSFQYFELGPRKLKPYWHFHPEMELTLITKGAGIRYVGDSILPFRSCDLVLLGENLPHQWVSEVDAHAIVVQFSMKDLLEIRELNSIQPFFGQSRRGLHFEPDDGLIKLFSSLSSRSRLGRLAILIELLDALYSKTSVPLASADYVMAHSGKFDKIQQVNAYVLDHMGSKITISDVANIASMTNESFCRWFKKETGNTFIDFLNATRVENATRLLLENKASVANIAFSVGFESISQFHRVFKRKKGQTPLQYRDALMPNN